MFNANYMENRRKINKNWLKIAVFWYYLIVIAGLIRMFLLMKQ